MAVLDPQHDKPWITGTDCAQFFLNGQITRRIIGQDHLQGAGIVLFQEALDGFDNGRRLIGQIGSDYGAGRRVRGIGFGWRVNALQRQHTLNPDQRGGHKHHGDQNQIHDAADIG